MYRFSNILCAVTPDKEGLAALKMASALALKTQARLTVLYVLPGIFSDISDPEGRLLPADISARILAEQEQALAGFIAPFNKEGKISTSVVMGTSFLEIIRAVIRDQHDLLVKTAENTAPIERLFGSDDMHLLRKCPCPVWLLKPEAPSAYRRIIAAVDVDPERAGASRSLNLSILTLAATAALNEEAELHVVHAWEAPGEIAFRTWSNDPEWASARYTDAEHARHKRALDDLADRFKQELGVKLYENLAPHFHQHRGIPSRVIPAQVRELQADLVVMGTVARTGIAGLLIGNTAESILEQLDCAVLALKPEGFVSPVR